jgi:hypothetical protein
MALGALERLAVIEHHDKVITKNVRNGNFLVLNVPHMSYPNGIGPDGEAEYISSDVMYKLSHIFRYMMDNQISQIDFKNFNDI